MLSDNTDFAIIVIETMSRNSTSESVLGPVTIVGLEMEETTTLILTVTEKSTLDRLLDRWCCQGIQTEFVHNSICSTIWLV